jgi:GNAT superfamily N-acetyltransferase
MADSENPALSIDAATSADIPVILGLIRELAAYEHLEHQVVGTPEALELALFGAAPSAAALIARVAGEPAGFALYFHNFSTFLCKPGLYLEDLYVRPDFRGRGVGKHLLVYLAGLAVQRDCGRFEWAVLDWNRPARDFYESLGAASNAEWINYRLTGDALRRLAAADLAAPPDTSRGPIQRSRGSRKRMP